MATELKERNGEIIKKRKTDPKKWTWATIGEHYKLHRSTVQKIYKRHLRSVGKKKKRVFHR